MTSEYWQNHAGQIHVGGAQRNTLSQVAEASRRRKWAQQAIPLKAAAGFRIPKCFARHFPDGTSLDCGSLLPLFTMQPAAWHSFSRPTSLNLSANYTPPSPFSKNIPDTSPFNCTFLNS